MNPIQAVSIHTPSNTESYTEIDKGRVKDDNINGCRENSNNAHNVNREPLNNGRFSSDDASFSHDAQNKTSRNQNATVYQAGRDLFYDTNEVTAPTGRNDGVVHEFMLETPDVSGEFHLTHIEIDPKQNTEHRSMGDFRSRTRAFNLSAQHAPGSDLATKSHMVKVNYDLPENTDELWLTPEGANNWIEQAARLAGGLGLTNLPCNGLVINLLRPMLHAFTKHIFYCAASSVTSSEIGTIEAHRGHLQGIDSVIEFTPNEAPGREQVADRAILYIPGGAYLVGGDPVHPELCSALAANSGHKVFLVTYPLAPDGDPSASFKAMDYLVSHADTLLGCSEFDIVGDSIACGFILKLLESREAKRESGLESDSSTKIHSAHMMSPFVYYDHNNLVTRNHSETEDFFGKGQIERVLAYLNERIGLNERLSADILAPDMRALPEEDRVSEPKMHIYSNMQETIEPQAPLLKIALERRYRDVKLSKFDTGFHFGALSPMRLAAGRTQMLAVLRALNQRAPEMERLMQGIKSGRLYAEKGIVVQQLGEKMLNGVTQADPDNQRLIDTFRELSRGETFDLNPVLDYLNKLVFHSSKAELFFQGYHK